MQLVMSWISALELTGRCGVPGGGRLADGSAEGRPWPIRWQEACASMQRSAQSNQSLLAQQDCKHAERPGAKLKL